MDLTNLTIRKTTARDIAALLSLFAEARATIAALGIDQWQNGYPNEAVIREDLLHHRGYLVERDGELLATFALIEDGEPSYDRIENGAWLTGDQRMAPHYLAIHRVAIAVCARGFGIASLIMEFAANRAAALDRTSLRIDTHHGNIVMRKMLEKQGFFHCGTIFLTDGALRVAYEKQLTEHQYQKERIH